MYLSLNWLKDFVSVPDSISAEELAWRLTTQTVEIDRVIKQAERFNKIVVGEILRLERHPRADKLQIAIVGTGREHLRIVCGAVNIKAGQLVPVAKIGARLVNNLEIKEIAIRGEKSFGMLCAEDELGLGADHSGIMILGQGARPGQNLAEYLGLKDTVFEVDNKSITHRGDLWSHYGLAREISVILGTSMAASKKPLVTRIKADDESMKIDVKIKDFKLCPRYMAAAMSGLKIEPSPTWLQRRLLAVGMRPINNIVDVANYVMLEIGQPLHTFDAALMRSKDQFNTNKIEIVVRPAKAGEIIETLDGRQRQLNKDNLVIANAKEAVAIAGIMGGADSEINNQTSSIVIESANFNYISIRKTSQQFSLRSEASMRFEKALDPNLCELGLARAVQLIKQICPRARLISRAIDKKKFKLYQGPVRLDLDWLDRRIGEEISRSKVVKILTGLGFKAGAAKTAARAGRNRQLSVIVPTWRASREPLRPEDLAEEVARVYGYNKIIPRLPLVIMRPPEFNQGRWLLQELKTILSQKLNLTEVYNYAFVGEENLTKLKIDFSEYIKLLNPLSSKETMLRQTLLPNLINNIKLNQTRYKRIALFETGSVYLNRSGQYNKDNRGKANLPDQEKRLAIILADAAASDRGQRQEKLINLFKELKGMIEYLLQRLGLTADFTVLTDRPGWASRQLAARIKTADRTVGLIAGLDQGLADELGLKQEVVAAELSLKTLTELISRSEVKKYQPAARYPALVRDLAFVVGEKILYNDIRREIINFHRLIARAELFDVYQGGKLGQGEKNLAFHITYQHPQKTLKAAEADQIQRALVNKLAKEFGAKVRDF